MTHTLFVLTAKILIRELHEHLQSCLLQKYHSNEVHYISVACLVNDLETKTARKRNCVLLNFVNFFGQFFCQFFVSLLSKNLSNKMVINLSKWPPRRSKVLKIQFWGILKMHVYEGNWTAKSRESMIRRIKKKQQEINHDIVIKMFENLKAKVHVANQNGLSSRLKF